MKRLICALLILMLVFGLSACSCSSTLKQPSGVSTQSSMSSANALQGSRAQITETVLVDEKGIKITAKSLDTDTLFGAQIKVLIENNSGKDLTFQSRNASVNGYMTETVMSVDVVNGKKANDTLSFTSSDLEAADIKTIADMEFSFHVFTTDSWDDYLDTPQIKLKTAAADTYNYVFDDSGEVAYQGNGIKIVVKGLANASLFGPGIVVYIENNGNKNITVQVRDVSVNGFMIEPIFSSDVMPGKHAIDEITFMSTDLEDNAITTIEKTELSFHVFNMDTMDTIVDTETVTITF